MIFSFEALRKSMIFQPETRTRNEALRNSKFLDFWTIFGPQIDPKSDAERSLFCDAMQTTRKSAEINGPHAFLTTNNQFGYAND